jgi:hypothetical protein
LLPTSTHRETKTSAARTALVVRLAVIGLLLASGSASLASEPVPTAVRQTAGLGSEALIAGWVMVFLAVTALYSFERRQRARIGPTAWDALTGREAAGRARPGREGEPSAEPRRSIDRLLKKKPGSEPVGPRLPVGPTPGLTPPSPRSLEPSRRGAKESGEESFRVVDAVEPASSPAPGPVVQPSPPSAGRAAPPPGCVERCAALRAAGRFDEAAHVARGGLARREADPGLLLIELSRTELALGRVNAAVDTARDAHFTSRSRASVRHLIWILSETRRFAKEDGDTLRRAAVRHPEQALLRHAAGVFESLHGEPSAAVRELRAALRLETEAERRRAIERDLARVRGKRARGGRAQRG